ncbi:hypothetical protein [Bosea sp. (in: a-proteobacteria)]|uniref:hypothetical protein n=1 Tax=Bosea sp. (in: a-proteobacteria) TaxID=1871050 RepID=UPI0026274782|nr:hypothetical protein [Bosea sp. (in: a-proteobacteria)]MCO5092697.1 hypothetical protein [Bosea sp. (in: a-proteobacteria)]
MTTADAAFYLFSFFNVLRVFSYLPQIVRVARDSTGAAAISYWTWGLWVAANTSTAAYALTSLGDVPLAAINMMNSLCCGIVIGLTAFKRHRLSRSCRSGPGKAGSGGLLLHVERQ